MELSGSAVAGEGRNVIVYLVWCSVLVGFLFGVMISDGAKAWFDHRNRLRAEAIAQENRRRFDEWWSHVPADWEYNVVCDWFQRGPYQYRGPHMALNTKNERYPALLKRAGM
jgi:hypothetical protein